MRKLWTGCLGLSLAWSGAGALAGEFAATRTEGASSAASLGRPVAATTPLLANVERPPVVDDNITPVGLNLMGRPRPLLAGRQAPELPPPTPQPSSAPTDVWGATQNRMLGQPVPPSAAPVMASPFVEAGGVHYGDMGPDCCMPGWPYADGGGFGSRCWVSGEYLLWWMRDSRLPPLVTTSPAGTALEQAGVLGTPGAGVLFGDSKIKHDERSGGRFSVGWWFDDCHRCGLDANFFFLGQRSVNYLASSGGNPILARPFVNVATGAEAAELVAFPGVVAGTVRVDLPSRLWGADGNFRTNLCGGCNWRLDGLVGYRYLDLHESLTVTEFLTDIRTPGQQSIIVVQDRFSARNQFHGGQIGLNWECRKGPWYLDVTGKVAFGCTHQTVVIDGTTTFAPQSGTQVTYPGGLLAQRSNSGRFTRDEFSVVPEIGVKLGYQVTPHLRAFIGYNFLYWSNVARPADQIDRVVNTTQLPTIFGPGQLVGPARPAFAFRDTEFWVQGISFGFELRY